ncbi:unnamed protein product [Penicillium camemberti]|uniref:Str. FM013 n=1 Tax=Penicillium camemberti (strain FM 013) TaxID=1429867 RepID=A0A0G4PK75_PENC3|nr:unnamed protein product [Penicillium camemberti]
MVGYYLKTVTMAAMVMSLSSSAFGCLEIKGTTFNWARHGNGEITTTDSGVQTCTGPVDEGDNNVGGRCQLPTATRLIGNYFLDRLADSGYKANLSQLEDQCSTQLRRL